MEGPRLSGVLGRSTNSVQMAPFDLQPNHLLRLTLAVNLTELTSPVSKALLLGVVVRVSLEEIVS